MAAPYLIVGLAGDSNGMWGKYRLTDGTDNCGARIFQYTQAGSVAVANEPLDNQGYSAADGQPGQVGSTVALCRLLRDNGHLPTGYDILIVPHCWAGTAMLDYWMVTPPYVDGVTGGRKALTPFINRLQAAMALHANNRIWFFDWNHGANDGGAVAGGVDVYKSRITDMWAEIRATIPTASKAPILVSGFPMNRVTNPPYVDANYPYQANVIDDIQTVESYIENSHYCEPAQPPVAHYDSSNGYVHHTASTHRGGTNNAPSTRGEVHTVAESLAGLKYAALTSAEIFVARLDWTAPVTPVTGTGALVAQPATIAGTGTVTAAGITGTGALVAQPAAVFGEQDYRTRLIWTGSLGSVSGTGALVAQSAAVFGNQDVMSIRLVWTSEVTVSGTGALSAQAATVSGIGASASSGTGALITAAATVSGTGTVANAITGTGALAAAVATASGLGVSSSTGSGALVAQPSTVVGTGTGIVAGTGSLAASVATVSGSGVSASTGTGALAAQSAAVRGLQAIAGTGTLAAAAAEVDGVGTVVEFVRPEPPEGQIIRVMADYQNRIIKVAA